jgi:putative membrane protein
MLIPFLFWVGLLALITWILRRLFPRQRGGGEAASPKDSAEEILRERFARGEVSEDEYLRALGILRGDMPKNMRETDARRKRGDEG